MYQTARPAKLYQSVWDPEAMMIGTIGNLHFGGS